MARTGEQIFQESSDRSSDYMVWANYSVLGQPVLNKPPFPITSNPYPPPTFLNTRNCSDIYISDQYFNDTARMPVFNIYLYKSGTGNNITVDAWSSAIGRKNGVWGSDYGGVYFSESTYQNPNAVGYRNKTNASNSWWVGYGTPQSEILVFDDFFLNKSNTPFRNLLESGNNQALNNNSEKVAFQIKKNFGAGVGVGDEYIKRQFYIKPRVNVGNISASYGTVRNERAISASWTFPYSSTSGTATHFLVELYDQANNTRKYYKEVAKSEGTNVDGSSKLKFTWNICNSKDLIPEHSYSLKITPYYKFNGTNYRYTNIITTVNNFVTFNPRPQVLPSINALSPNIRKDEQNFNITFSYNNRPETNGVVKKFVVVLVDGGITYNVGTVNNSYANSNAGVKTYTIPVTILGLNIQTSGYYYCKVTPVYDGSYNQNGTHNYSLTGSSAIYNNYVRRDPRPTNQVSNLKVKVNGEYVEVSHVVKPVQESLDLIWSYDDSNPAETGISNYYKLEFVGGATFIVPQKSASIGVNNFSLGVAYTLVITPLFSEIFEGTNPKTYTDFLMINSGLSDIERISPTRYVNATWFFGDTDNGEKSLFRIAFRLPKDNNYDFLTQEEKDAYRYNYLEIRYVGEGESIVRTYDISDNSTEDNPTYICVSGNGELTHQNTVIIDMTGIDLDPATATSGGVEEKVYRIFVEVESQYGSIKRASYRISIVDFPLAVAEDGSNGDYPRGSYISAESMNKFIEARNIVATFTDRSISASVVAGDKIKYSDLQSLIEPINALYLATAGWDNVKRYEMPRAISPDGSLSSNAPAYLKSNPEVYDHIFAITNKKTGLSQLSEVPDDYAEEYNKYFQQPLGNYNYTFRSVNGNVPVEGADGLPLYSASEFNVSWSYFLLYWCLHTKTVLADYYLMQTTAQYTNSDSQTYGGWITIPDLELKTTYTYEIDADLNPSTPSRLWTIAGGSYQHTPDDREFKYRGLFLVLDGETGKLRMELAGQQSSDDCPPLDIVEGRNTYTLHGNSITPSMNQVWTTDTYGSVDDGYIYVDDMELYTDYTFEITGSLDKEFGRCYTIIGGTGATNTEGLFVCEDGNNGNFLNLQTGIQYNTGVISDEDIRPYINTPHTFVLAGNGSHTQATSGGFYIMNGRDSINDAPFVPAYTYIAPFVNGCGTVQEIKIKDASNNVVADFIPEAYEGVSGVRDKVSNKFYPATRPDRIYVNQEERTYTGFMLLAPKDYSLVDGKILGEYKKVDALYGNYGKFYKLSIYDENQNLIKSFVPKRQNEHIGVLELVNNVFYPCNDDDKFYIYREGQAPLSLFMLGNPDEEEENPEEEEEP